jgi:hypothetical protein
MNGEQGVAINVEGFRVLSLLYRAGRIFTSSLIGFGSAREFKEINKN